MEARISCPRENGRLGDATLPPSVGPSASDHILPKTRSVLGYSCERAVETPAGFELRAIGVSAFSCVASSCSTFIGTSAKGRAVETPAGFELRAIGISDSISLEAEGGFSFVLIRSVRPSEAWFIESKAILRFLRIAILRIRAANFSCVANQGQK
jgi:hypothetical protein